MGMVTVTELQNWLRCRRKHHISSLQPTARGLTLAWPSQHFVLGSLIHSVGEIWLTDPKANLVDVFTDQAALKLRQLVTAYEQAKHDLPTQAQLSSFNDSVTLGKAMCGNYQLLYKQPLPPGFTLIQPEQQLVTPIPNTLHCVETNCLCSTCDHTGVDNCPCTEACGGRCNEMEPHYLESKLDAVVADVAGRYYVFERKTYAQRPNPKYLKRDMQFLAYTWVLVQATGVNTAGIAYDGWWKRFGRETGFQGKSPKYRLADLFYRDFFTRPIAELIEFEQQLTSMALDIFNPNTPIYKSVPWSGCKDCLDLMPICDAMSYDEDLPLSDYIRRDIDPVFKEFYGDAAE
jgi:hypothetical protein